MALRGLSLGPATNGPTALSIDYYTTRGRSQPAWREGGETTLIGDTQFDWKKIVTHRFLLCAFFVLCFVRLLHAIKLPHGFWTWCAKRKTQNFSFEKGGEIILIGDTRFAWNKNVTHRFLRYVCSLCSVLRLSHFLEAVGCVLRVFRVIYVPVSVPLALGFHPPQPRHPWSMLQPNGH